MSQPREVESEPSVTPEIIEVAEAPAEDAVADVAPDVIDVKAGEQVEGEAAASTDDAPPDEEVAEEPKVERPPIRTLVDVLRDQLVEKELQLHEYIQAYKSAKSDMGERISRLERDRQKVIDRDRKKIANDLLEVLDNLDRSIAAMADPESTTGLRMVHRQFLKVLTEFGVEPADALGSQFDANVHEAIGMIPASGDQADQQVIHVDRAGYRFKGELLRPARVIVATKG